MKNHLVLVLNMSEQTVYPFRVNREDVADEIAEHLKKLMGVMVLTYYDGLDETEETDA